MDRFYSLGHLLGRASVALSKSLNARLEACDIDLPHSQFIVLRCLYYKDALSQLDIAKLLSKDAAAIKRTIDSLEKKELVIRKQTRTLKNSVCISDKGKKLMPQVLKIADNLINEALNGIEIDNQELLLTMLDKIYTNTLKIKQIWK
jgi:DNA-binding MarR family transcriptional regulator